MVLIRMRTEGEVITFLLIGMGVARLLRIYLFAAILHLIRYIVWVFVVVISVFVLLKYTSNWPKILGPLGLHFSPNLEISRIAS